MRLQVGVKVLLRNDNGKYLFMERSEPHPDGSGIRWDIPGGRIEPQEKLLEALKREVREETGIELHSVPELLNAQDIVIPDIDLHVVRLTYRADADGDLELSKEHAVCKWLTLDEAKAINVDDYLRSTLAALTD